MLCGGRSWPGPDTEMVGEFKWVWVTLRSDKLSLRVTRVAWLCSSPPGLRGSTLRVCIWAISDTRAGGHTGAPDPGLSPACPAPQQGFSDEPWNVPDQPGGGGRLGTQTRVRSGRQAGVSVLRFLARVRNMFSTESKHSPPSTLPPGEAPAPSPPPAGPPAPSPMIPVKLPVPPRPGLPSPHGPQAPGLSYPKANFPTSRLLLPCHPHCASTPILPPTGLATPAAPRPLSLRVSLGQTSVEPRPLLAPRPPTPLEITPASALRTSQLLSLSCSAIVPQAAASPRL